MHAYIHDSSPNTADGFNKYYPIFLPYVEIILLAVEKGLE
jgi:hypothetical protein